MAKVKTRNILFISGRFNVHLLPHHATKSYKYTPPEHKKKKKMQKTAVRSQRKVLKELLQRAVEGDAVEVAGYPYIVIAVE